MRVLIINDTRIENNPGCHATVNSLIDFVSDTLTESNIETLPLGEGYEFFLRKDLFRKKKFSFLRPRYRIKNEFQYTLWERVVLGTFRNKYSPFLQKFDLIIINMEGTIHHNSIGGLTLLAFCNLASLCEKKIAMVNGSYQEMDEKFLNILSKRVHFLSLRESISYDILSAKLDNINIIPDFALNANIFEVYRGTHSFSKHVNYCLYTPGVLGAYPQQKNGRSLEKISQDINEIKKLGYVPVFLKIEQKENIIEKFLLNKGIKCYSVDDQLNSTNIGSFLEEFDIVITGRYHIGIFGLMSKVPTFFLPSNTHKIEGFLKMIGREELFIENIRKISTIKSEGEEVDFTRFNDHFKFFKKFLISVDEEI
ncbi:polysaccharide pyruvyl transferase family protein [Christiangramia echinicola]|uniref:polysaccharide pyruvyl transferase family protein n=1 Tax=Christiangramia echinicola TaxID=279359 RepID=UPI000420E619|nr:polysaccharide pyruvyl transferase family protein [Christiangramia echinicola]